MCKTKVAFLEGRFYQANQSNLKALIDWKKAGSTSKPLLFWSCKQARSLTSIEHYWSGTISKSCPSISMRGFFHSVVFKLFYFRKPNEDIAYKKTLLVRNEESGGGDRLEKDAKILLAALPKCLLFLVRWLDTFFFTFPNLCLLKKLKSLLEIALTTTISASWNKMFGWKPLKSILLLVKSQFNTKLIFTVYCNESNIARSYRFPLQDKGHVNVEEKMLESRLSYYIPILYL